jgi:AcrR family transcriptional regulator
MSLPDLLPAAVVEIPGGLREKNKAAKLQRIHKAARALFIRHGYDDATMREIAKGADVGFGTLFSYASNKRDLLFLIFNDELDKAVEEAFARAGGEALFIDQLVAYFAVFYAFFGLQPELSRIVLREMAFYVDGRQAQQFRASCARMKQHLAELFVAARQARRLSTREDPEIVADALMSTYGAEIRHWVAADKPVLEEGLARLRRMLAVQIEGLRPRRGALSAD